jgi:hypothetical protein
MKSIPKTTNNAKAIQIRSAIRTITTCHVYSILKIVLAKLRAVGSPVDRVLEAVLQYVKVTEPLNSLAVV